MRHACVLAAFCLLAAVAYADDWPTNMGDLSHSSSRPNETQINPGNVRQLQQLWRTPLGATVSTGVTVADGSLFVGDWDGFFRSINAATGVVAWSQFLGKSPAPSDDSCGPGIGVGGQAAVDSANVYVAGGDSAVYAMDRRTGQIQWRVPLADPQSGAFLWSLPMLSHNALYVGIASLADCPLVRGGLARIPLDDPAHPQVRHLMPENTQGASVWSTPAIDEKNGLVYVTTGNADSQDAEQGVWGSALLALDATTLEIKACFFLPVTEEEDDADWGSSPVLFEAGGQPLIAANGKNGVMYVLHRPDLTLLWSSDLARDCDSPILGCGSISTPAFDGNVLVTGAGQPDGDFSPLGTVYAFDPAHQKLLWTYSARAAVLAPVTLTPGLVYVPTTQGLAVLDGNTGAELWADSGMGLGGLYSQAVVSNGVLYTTYIGGGVIAWGVPAGPGGSASLAVLPAALRFQYTSGGTVPPQQTITVYASAASVNITATSDSTWLTTDRLSAATPAPIAVRASASGLAAGVYTGNLTFAAAGSSPITVPITLVVNGPLPSLTQTNVVSAASFQSGSLAPGGLFSIFAGNLAAETVMSPWLTTVSGVTVRVNGIAAPLSYLSPTQINGQIPYEIQAGPAMLTLESNGVVTDPVALPILPAAPGIFVDAVGRAAALNQDYTLNLPESPAPAGSIVSVYFTGQGQVDRQIQSGTPAPSDGLSNTLAETTATVGGIAAVVTFSGLAPGFVGLAQANLQIPVEFPAGDYPVVLSVNGVMSNPGVISISQP